MQPEDPQAPYLEVERSAVKAGVDMGQRGGAGVAGVADVANEPQMTTRMATVTHVAGDGDTDGAKIIIPQRGGDGGGMESGRDAEVTPDLGLPSVLVAAVEKAGGGGVGHD